MESIKSKPGSDAAMFGKQRERFIKMFMATRAMITSFPVMEEGVFAHKREVFEDGSPVIMNGFGNGTAIRTGVRFSL